MFTKKYRPKTFQEFIGNESAIKGLLSSFPDWPSTFLLIGPPGIGKTTLARLIAKQLEAIEVNIREIDAGQDRGIDNIRKVIGSAYNRPLMGTTKVYIFDECQGLTNDAQQALLKVTEDTPANTYFIFCSTNPQKIIKALKERCKQGTYNLSPLTIRELGHIIKHICDTEKIKLEGLVKDIATLCIKNAEGIPRAATMHFHKFYQYEKLEDVVKEIEKTDDNVPEEFWPMINHLSNGDIKNFLELYQKNITGHFEGFRIVMGHIFKKKLLKAMIAKDKKEIIKYNHILSIFSKPVDDTQGDTELIYRFSNFVIINDK